MNPGSRTTLRIVLYLFLLLGSPLLDPQGSPFAHGLHDERIEAFTRMIREGPMADLYLNRGEIYRLHDDWDLAESDYRQAALLDPELTQVELCYGHLRLNQGRFEEALSSGERFLAHNLEDVKGILLRAYALHGLGRSLEAAGEMERAEELLERPTVDHFLQWARMLAEISGSHVGEAIEVLDLGMERLGLLVSLQNYAIDLELVRGEYDRALERLDRILVQFDRKESIVAQRGEILQQCGRFREAREAFKEALAAIEALPPGRRSRKNTRELEKRVRTALGAEPQNETSRQNTARVK